jgi:serine/threonine protein kinase
MCLRRSVSHITMHWMGIADNNHQGHGSFGVIRKVRRKNDGLVMCRKEISYLKMSQKEREQLHAEFQILSTLSHPNIVKYYHREHLKQSQDLHFYMEYCGNGDLGRVIRDLAQKNQYAEESFVWSIFAQLVTALYRCHYGVDPPEVGKTILGLGSTAKPKAPTGGMTILHRDLKPENGKCTWDLLISNIQTDMEQSSSARTTRSNSATSVCPR